MFDINDLNTADKKKKFVEVLLIVGGIVGGLGLVSASGAKAVSEDAITVYLVTATYMTYFVFWSIFLYVLLIRPLKLLLFVENFLF